MKIVRLTEPITQICTVCGRDLPLDQFYKKDDSGRSFSMCIEDYLAGKRERYAEAHPAREKIQPTEKACSECGAVLLIDQFGWKDRKAGRRREKCPECHNMATRQYKADNRAKVRASDAAYRATVGNEALSERQKKWRDEHPEENQTIHRKWKRGNKDKVNTATNNRRARIKGLDGSYTVAELQGLYDQYSRTCLWCRRVEPEIKLSPDHVIPVTVSGATNWLANLQPLCAGVGGCNYKKGDRTFDLRPFWPGLLPEYVELPDGSLFSLQHPRIEYQGE